MAGKNNFKCVIALPGSGLRRKLRARVCKSHADAFFVNGSAIIASLEFSSQGRSGEVGVMIFPDGWRDGKYRGNYTIRPRPNDCLSEEEISMALAVFAVQAPELIGDFLRRLQAFC